jgi:hypothetical protein
MVSPLGAFVLHAEASQLKPSSIPPPANTELLKKERLSSFVFTIVILLHLSLPDISIRNRDGN